VHHSVVTLKNSQGHFHRLDHCSFFTCIAFSPSDYGFNFAFLSMYFCRWSVETQDICILLLI
jgi:hypothetical protein